jgi:hypothetical protein
MRNNAKRCACGLPLHYTNKETEAQITKLSDELGEWMPVQVGHERYMVQRHYIALHGLKGNQIQSLMEQGIVRHG